MRNVLCVMNADVYSIAVGTVASGWGISEGEYLFQMAVGVGWEVGIRGVWGKDVRHSVNVRNIAMSVR